MYAASLILITGKVDIGAANSLIISISTDNAPSMCPATLNNANFVFFDTEWQNTEYKNPAII